MRYWISDLAGTRLLKENGMWLHIPRTPGDSRHLLTFASLAEARAWCATENIGQRVAGNFCRPYPVPEGPDHAA